METLLHVDFENMPSDSEIRDRVAREFASLEEKFGRIIAGRVAIKAPGGHHKTGGPYEVHIALTLPDGREVNASRRNDLDERHADLAFAVADAFQRARRQLQDEVEQMRESHL